MPQTKKIVPRTSKARKSVARAAPPAHIRAARSAQAAADVRGALLKASLGVLAEEGLEAATVKRIASVAGVNHGLVHYYFGSKEAMLLEAFKADQQRALESVSAILGAPDSGKSINDLWQLMRKDLHVHRRVKISAQITALSIYNPELTNDINQSNREYAAEVGKLLSARLGRKSRAGDALAARLLMGGLVTLSLWALRENPKKLDDAFDMLTRMISSELKR